MQRRAGHRCLLSHLADSRQCSRRLTGIATIGRDVTGQKQAQEALRTSEKLAATGRMAATIAHEINNPLEAVMNLST